MADAAGPTLAPPSGSSPSPSSLPSPLRPYAPSSLRRFAPSILSTPSAAIAPMLRTLLAALAILHLGPGIAFALIAFGCDGAAPALGSVCGQGGFASFAWITVAAWVVLGAAYALLRRRIAFL